MSAPVVVEHRQFGAGCTGCEWVSDDPSKSLKADHAEHVRSLASAVGARGA